MGSAAAPAGRDAGFRESYAGRAGGSERQVRDRDAGAGRDAQRGGTGSVASKAPEAQAESSADPVMNFVQRVGLGSEAVMVLMHLSAGMQKSVMAGFEPSTDSSNRLSELKAFVADLVVNGASASAAPTASESLPPLERKRERDEGSENSRPAAKRQRGDDGDTISQFCAKWSLTESSEEKLRDAPKDVQDYVIGAFHPQAGCDVHLKFNGFLYSARKRAEKVKGKASGKGKKGKGKSKSSGKGEGEDLEYAEFLEGKATLESFFSTWALNNVAKQAMMDIPRSLRQEVMDEFVTEDSNHIPSSA